MRIKLVSETHHKIQIKSAPVSGLVNGIVVTSVAFSLSALPSE